MLIQKKKRLALDIISERMVEIVTMLGNLKPYSLENVVLELSNHLSSKIRNTNKCYRIPLFELASSDNNVINGDDLPKFKEALVSRLTELGLVVEEEKQELLKIECSNKIKAEQLPSLSELQLKILEFCEVRNDADDILKQSLKKQKLSQREYDELQLVRNYEF